MELQGSFDTIPAHDSISWDVKWIARKLPDSIAVRVGPQLLNFVNQAVAGLSTPTALQGRGRPSFFGIDYSEGRIRLDLIQASFLSLSLVNSQGREISRIHDGKLPEGVHEFSVSASVPKGVYWLVVRGSDHAILSQQRLVRLRN